MKHHNPYTPILIREAMGFEPRVIARYEFGREQAEDLKGKKKSNMKKLSANALEYLCLWNRTG